MPILSRSVSLLLPAAAVLALAWSGAAPAADTRLDVLHAFAGQAQGERPVTLVAGPDGKLYGTTGSRASGNGASLGTVFRIGRDGSQYEVLHQFRQGQRNAFSTTSELLPGSDGALYGYSSQTGIDAVSTAFNNGGLLFKVEPASGAVRILYAFPPADTDPYFNGTAPNDAGFQPTGLVEQNGVLYGITRRGGTQGYGTAFRFDPASGTFSVLHTFGGTLTRPHQLKRDAQGRLIGLAGTRPFELYPSGGIRPIDATVPADGIGTPTLLPRAEGGFYGAGSGRQAGTHGTGALFALDIDAAPAYTLLHAFDPEVQVSSQNNATWANIEGRNPGDLADAGDGTLIGYATQGGASANGVLFRFAPATRRLEVKYTFPFTKQVQAGSAIPVDDVTPNATGAFPSGALVRDGQAWLGVASHGGAHGLGTLYRVTPGDDDVRTPQLVRWEGNLMSTMQSTTGELVYLHAEGWTEPEGTVWTGSGYVAAVDWSALGATHCTGDTDTEADAGSGLTSGSGTRYGARPIEQVQAWRSTLPTEGRYIFILRTPGTYRYTLRCTGPDGDTERALRIEVRQLPQPGDDDVPQFGNGGGALGLGGLALLGCALRRRHARPSAPRP